MSMYICMFILPLPHTEESLAYKLKEQVTSEPVLNTCTVHFILGVIFYLFIAWKSEEHKFWIKSGASMLHNILSHDLSGPNYTYKYPHLLLISFSTMYAG